MTVAECLFCDKDATGTAEVIDANDGTHYVLALCDDCGKHFSVPAGTYVEMPVNPGAADSWKPTTVDKRFN